MRRFNNIVIGALCIFALTPALALADSTSTASGTPAIVVPLSFCDRVDTLTENVHADATQVTDEHRADVQRLDSEREGDKVKSSEDREQARADEDATQAALIEVLHDRAVSPIENAAIDDFASASLKYLHDLRAASDKARDTYEKAVRPAAAGARAKRDKALSAYIDSLNTANVQAEEACAKGANDQRVMDEYNLWLKQAKDTLAKSLKQKKTTLEQRARDAHLAELARLQKQYQRDMQQAMQKLSGAYPDLFATATDTPADTASSTDGPATGTPPAQK